jgi:GT2 family glycosyltransferase
MTTAPPSLSIVVLAWNKPELTRRCVQSVRDQTASAYELILVDNGSESEGRELARSIADVAVLHPSNRGFAAGMNSGLAVARGEAVAFLNNDIVLPPNWDVPLLGSLERPKTGVVAPGVTEAGNRVSVRSATADRVTVLTPFRAVPSAVVYVLETAVARALGGWDERYTPAGAEDADLCFQLWVNDLDVVLDERVLVHHVSKGTASQLGDHRAVWGVNRRRLLFKWGGRERGTARLPGCDVSTFVARRRQARFVAWSMAVYFATVARLPQSLRRRMLPSLRVAATTAARAVAPVRKGPA